MQITEIQATKLPELKLKRVAAYARVSSKKDAALHSVSSQISYFNEYISNHPGWEFAGIYADEGITGTRDNRPEFQRMLADCRAGKIDMIITKAATRFARNAIDLLQIIRELRALNVDIFFENDHIHTLSPTGDMMLTLLAMYAEEGAREASENQKWRIQKMFEKGRPNTGRMLGYYLKDGELTIIPEEAEIVKQIFADYLSGMGRLAIAKKLSTQGIQPVRGGEWREGSIYRILRNEKYTGDMLLQKTYIKDFRTKKGVINKGERRQYYVENSHEPIIDKETFAAAQAEAERRLSKIKLCEKPQKTIFSGMLTCASCGKHFRRRVANASTKYARPAWICGTFATKGKDVCNMKQIPEDILITKTKEALDLESIENINLKDYLTSIICDRRQLTYIFNDGTEKILPWESISRKYSWTEEMKQQVRERNSRKE